MDWKIKSVTYADFNFSIMTNSIMTTVNLIDRAINKQWKQCEEWIKPS